MIEQKLQSNVQPRDVSTTSTVPAEQRVAAEHARVAVGQPELAVFEAEPTGRSGLWTNCRPSRPGEARRCCRSSRRARSRAAARETSCSPSPRTMKSTPRRHRRRRRAPGSDRSRRRRSCVRGTQARACSLMRRSAVAALERHHRQADDVGRQLASTRSLDRRRRRDPARESGRRSRRGGAGRRCRPAR